MYNQSQKQNQMDEVDAISIINNHMMEFDEHSNIEHDQGIYAYL